MNHKLRHPASVLLLGYLASISLAVQAAEPSSKSPGIEVIVNASTRT